MVAARTSSTPADTPLSTPSTAAADAALHPYFGRVITAMVTPFKRNSSEIDYNTAEQLASHLVSFGSDALVIAGTTGESPTLSWSEQYELFTAVRNAVGDRAKLIAGAGSNSTAEAIEATRRAAKLGLDATLQVVPYYNKPPQEGMYQHFAQIAKAEPDLPVMLYNIPSRTGVNMQPQTISKLSQINNIIAVKQATADMEELQTVRATTSSDFHIYAGDDSLTLPFLTMGASGVVSVASHFVGPDIQNLVKSYIEGDVSAASAIHMRYAKLFSDLFCMTNPIPTKTALRLLGWNVGGCRLPLVDAPPEVEERLAQLLSELGLL
ncbi:dihydrodipicolinate synthase [Gracilaria domingensis]|nr:dihydrodipicolinate synthase [Gracilaria domingensis]